MNASDQVYSLGFRVRFIVQILHPKLAQTLLIDTGRRVDAMISRYALLEVQGTHCNPNMAALVAKV